MKTYPGKIHPNRSKAVAVIGMRQSAFDGSPAMKLTTPRERALGVVSPRGLASIFSAWTVRDPLLFGVQF